MNLGLPHPHLLPYILQDGKVGMPPAEVLLAQRIQYLGTSAQQAAEAFQALKEASKDLVDLEIVIPAGHSVQDAQNIPIPYDRSRGTDIGLPEYKMLVNDAGIDKVLSDLFREPWYKRLWSLFWNRWHEPLAVSMDRLYDARQALIRPFVDVVGGAPFRLWSWLLRLGDQRPLTDSDLQKASEDLDRIIRLPTYKRIPALILWLWRLP